MKYLLDTNACIGYLSGRVPKLMQRMRTTPKDLMVVCSVVKAELFYGAMKSQQPQQTLAGHLRFFSQFKSLPFDDDAALIFGELRADLARKGRPIGPYDLQIAAIALAHQLTLVTHNTAEFSRIAQLALVDWEV
jgi:tRNA(fMet)-specific endonuclease VapC